MRQVIPRRLLRWLLPALAASLLLGAVFVTRSVAARPPDRGERSKPLPVAVVEIAREARTTARRAATGRVVARRRSPIAFEIAGRVVALPFDDGEAVEEGAVLARLDTTTLEAERRELRARRDAEEAVLEELEAGPRVETIGAAEAEVARIAAELELARRKAARRAGLLAIEALSEEEVESARSAVRALEARRRGARERLEELRAGTRPERLAAQKARVAGIEAGLARVALEIEKATVRAPFAGRITERAIDEGTVLLPGTPLFTLVETGVLEVRIGLVAGEDLEVGTTHALEVDGREVPARLRAWEPTLDARTRTRTAIFVLESATGLVPGHLARFVRERALGASGFWLPRTALRRSVKGLFAVHVVVGEGDEGRIERRAVEVLHEEGDRVLVRGTLEEGDRVVPEGNPRIVEGQTVRIVERRR